jgi:riboflavin synthase alpha subunit
MFTGIIEDLAELASRASTDEGARLRVHQIDLTPALTLGESIAVDGVCLTVVASGRDWFEADGSAQTLRITTLGQLPPAAPLNLERPLTTDGRLGGHFVQGHVDAVGEVRTVRREGDGKVIGFSRPAAVTDLLVPRGSVTVNGVSLTVSALQPEVFEVALIPHTLEVTNLGALEVGSPVNLEADILGKYVRQFLTTGSAGVWEPPS